ncbi:MAG: ribonuclease P protein component [Candidatus Neomarinimicrobiota bacterium]
MAEERRSPEDAQKEEKSCRLNLPREQRFLDWNTRQRLINTHKAIRFDNMLISVVPFETWKLSVSIRRNIKGSVHRNRIKRIIREAFRNSRGRFDQPVAMLFTVLSEPSNLVYADLCQAIINQA